MSEFLQVYGAKTHNLKNINVKIPKNKMVVITGLSGSGKSSLAFNTIYSIGQQKYLESLSSYARMFIGGMKEEAEIDEISGLSPTISIDQKTTNRNPRSTAGTITEIYDYYKLLYLNVGDRKCLKCGSIIKKDTISNIVSDISSYQVGTKFIIKSPLYKDKKNTSLEKIKKEILDLGFIRFSLNGKIYTVNDDIVDTKEDSYNVDIVVDRLVVGDYEKNDSDIKRLKDSLELSFRISGGFANIDFLISETKTKTYKYSSVFVCPHCSYVPEKLDISSFSFNSHNGACPDCHGLGVKTVFLEENIINFNLSLEEGAVIVPGFGTYFHALIKAVGEKYPLRTRVPYKELTKKEKEIALYGTGETQYKVKFTNDYGVVNTYNSKFEGVMNTLNRRFFESATFEENKLMDFVTEIDCPECNGKRLKQESLTVFVGGIDIGDLSNKTVKESLDFFTNLNLSGSKDKISKNILKNIVERLEFLAGVGLGYITMARKSNTLSGGESQRIRLATQLGTKLEGIIYVLDEPSIGLHPRDNDMLIGNLKKLRDIGNTLIIVEHDEDIMRESDYIIDIGPGAGIHGGNIIFEGKFEQIIKDKNTLTGKYLSGEIDIKIDRKERKKEHFLELKGATHHNLKNVDIKIPLSIFTVITGVSGGGKSSLINDTLAVYLQNKLNGANHSYGNFREIKGLEYLDKILVIDQSPIGKTPRSNPATYTGVLTYIREVFAATYDAQIRGYGPGRFSFNTKDGRCNICEGDGVKKIEMHFLPPIYVECEECHGKRFNYETLEIKYKGKNIADVLDMTIEEAIDFFASHPKILRILKVLENIGLGYIKLGQSSTTLSGGEAQRIKLATELAKRSTTKTIYVLDEPTTGLHFQDVEKLLILLHGLVDKGNTVVVIEHNMNVIMNADYIIDIGPEGGNAGGEIVVSGDLEALMKCEKSFTGHAIKKYLKK
ncbi:excinuclease ABC subunit UvrA [Candidatus Gracilibacteria bacterium]|nr:excinuclease ABC subunit UvrA [Candidatus Gracilibacteria bacterium]NUJ98690.1 excinuclease ABC subunit UvrA [Candidatus Gracilibacteria bacterium]